MKSNPQTTAGFEIPFDKIPAETWITFMSLRDGKWNCEIFYEDNHGQELSAGEGEGYTPREAFMEALKDEHA